MKTFDKEIWGGTKPQWRYSGILVTEMIEGFVGFEIFDSRILLGQETLASIFLVGLTKAE